MSGKNLEKAPTDTAPTRTSATDGDYGRRYGQLKRDAKRSLPKSFTIDSFIGWLIDTKRPTWSASSWRQNRAAARFGLNLERAAHPALGAKIEAAIARLDGTRPAQRKNPSPRTSQKKAKRLPTDDHERICHAALASASPNRQKLVDFLFSSTIAGLRPSEWPTAEFRKSAMPGFAFELIVRTGKHDAVRANGAVRTLRWVALNAPAVSAITNWIAVAREAERTNTYKTLIASLGDSCGS